MGIISGIKAGDIVFVKDSLFTKPLIKGKVLRSIYEEKKEIVYLIKVIESKNQYVKVGDEIIRGRSLLFECTWR